MKDLQIGLPSTSDTRGTGRKISPYFLAILFGLAVAAIPWEESFGIYLRDRDAYRAAFESANPIILSEEIHEIRMQPTGEILWRIVNTLLVGNIGIPFETLLALYTVIIASSFFLFTVRNSSIPSSVLLINPLVFELALSQVRSGIAMAILLLAWRFRGTFLFILPITAIGIAALIHSASLIVIAIYVSAIAIRKISVHYTPHQALIPLLTYLVFGVLFAYVIVFGREEILERLGDRRLTVDYAGATFKYLIFWGLSLLALILTYFRKQTETIGSIAIVALAMVMALGVFDFSANRFLALFLPIFICSFLEMPKATKLIIISLYILNTLAQWAYWLELVP